MPALPTPWDTGAGVTPSEPNSRKLALLMRASRSAFLSHACRSDSDMPDQMLALGREVMTPWFASLTALDAGEPDDDGRVREGGGGRDGTERGAALAVREVISSKVAGGEVEVGGLGTVGFPRTAISRCRT